MWITWRPAASAARAASITSITMKGSTIPRLDVRMLPSLSWRARPGPFITAPAAKVNGPHPARPCAPGDFCDCRPPTCRGAGRRAARQETPDEIRPARLRSPHRLAGRGFRPFGHVRGGADRLPGRGPRLSAGKPRSPVRGDRGSAVAPGRGRSAGRSRPRQGECQGPLRGRLFVRRRQSGRQPDSRGIHRLPLQLLPQGPCRRGGTRRLGRRYPLHREGIPDPRRPVGHRLAVRHRNSPRRRGRGL